MAEVKVLLFGPLSEAYGNSEIIHEIKDSYTPETLLQKMGLTDWKNKGLRCAINQKICGFDELISEGDEIVFLTPVSGG